VLVEAARLEGDEDVPREPPWTVVVWQGDTEVARFSRPGEYAVRLPCAHREGAAEAASVRLREFKVVDLEVGGHRVSAELADTPAKLSWGLQGRDGLGPDEGMLFFFERPLRPVFAMKTVSFPLSIAFVRADGTIVSVEKLSPGDRRRVTSPVPVNYALEMAQGWFESHDVAPGGGKVTMP
jgi:uncharacterized membrane protein (UPF0127 family)